MDHKTVKKVKIEKEDENTAFADVVCVESSEKEIKKEVKEEEEDMSLPPTPRVVQQTLPDETETETAPLSLLLLPQLDPGVNPQAVLSTWDGEDVVPQLRLISHDEPSEDSDPWTIHVPEHVTSEFVSILEQLSHRRYKRLYLNFAVDCCALHRSVLLQLVGDIQAETVSTERTWMTKHDFPLVIRNKVAFFIIEEYTTMYSSAYHELIVLMFTRRIELKYFETPLRNSSVVNGLIHVLRNDVWLRPLCKVDNKCLYIEEGTFKLKLENDGFLTVEVDR